MSAALAGKPEKLLTMPENVITVLVNDQTGRPTDNDDPGGYLEFFVMGTEPRDQITDKVSADGAGGDPTGQVDKLF